MLARACLCACTCFASASPRLRGADKHMRTHIQPHSPQDPCINAPEPAHVPVLPVPQFGELKRLGASWPCGVTIQLLAVRPKSRGSIGVCCANHAGVCCSDHAGRVWCADDAGCVCVLCRLCGVCVVRRKRSVCAE